MSDARRNPYQLAALRHSPQPAPPCVADGPPLAVVGPPLAVGGPPLAADGPPLAVDGQLLPERRCPLCQHPTGWLLRPDSRCAQCQSPLAALPGPGQQGQEGLGRRGAVRRDQGHVLLMQVGWPAATQAVRWRDLSLTGLSLFVPQPLAAGTRLRLIDPALEAVAEVVRCRAQGRVQVVHAQLLTALLLQSTGVFMSTTA